MKTPSERLTVELRVNGASITREVEARTLLADLLRDELGLTATRLGCEHGVCGACTILVDGESVRSCLMLAVQADGSEIRTVEGLADGERMHPVQQAFWDHHALQCGFCTSGFLMTAVDFLGRNANPTAAEVREAISGNLCRCTGYETIVDAVLAAAKEPR